ncbi:hypothetical protein M413DRAFT_7918 [Hebeloma cylindrosporum]|uniref:RRM domain-containing protein n=1 Tax=Hebeloma cylindrosporum TaxID=76867 RepID=A0A0C2YY04_HEBCY|nr:hypothetical protein M413DRAFT_7918 [Hebeloma cylindrosporum h7]
MSRERSKSPSIVAKNADMEVDSHSPAEKPDTKVIVVTNLTRNVVESHLKTIFGFYGHITKIDLPVFGKSGQNRGKAALEFADSASAQKAASHMDGGQLDSATVKVELSQTTIVSPSRSPDQEADATDLDPSPALVHAHAPVPAPAHPHQQTSGAEAQEGTPMVLVIVIVTLSAAGHTVVVVDHLDATFTDQTVLVPALARLFAVVKKLFCSLQPFRHPIPLTFALAFYVLLKRFSIHPKQEPHEVSQQGKEKSKPR